MSKLVDRLKETATGGRSIGFPTGRTSKVPPVLIVAELPMPSAELADAAIAGGASVLLLSLATARAGAVSGEFKKVVADVVKLAGDRPCGLALEGAGTVDRDTVETIAEAGIDFILMRAEEMPASLLEAEGIGRAVAIDDTYTDAQLRTLGELEVDAVQITVASAGAGSGLTVFDMVRYQRLALIVHKPLIAAVSAQMTPEDVTLLHGIGIQSVLLGPATLGTTADSIKQGVTAYAEAVSKLKARPKRRPRGSLSPSIGALAARAGGSDHDEPDEDEE